MSNKTYDFLKLLVMRILPAILTFVGIVLATLHYEYTEIVLTIGTAFITMLGTILGISSNRYYINVETSNGKGEVEDEQ